MVLKSLFKKYSHINMLFHQFHNHEEEYKLQFFKHINFFKLHLLIIIFSNKKYVKFVYYTLTLDYLGFIYPFKIIQTKHKCKSRFFILNFV